MDKASVVAFFGTQQKVADAVGVTRQAVQQWPDPIPEGMAYKLQVLTAGRLRVNPANYPRRSQSA